MVILCKRLGGICCTRRQLYVEAIQTMSGGRTSNIQTDLMEDDKGVFREVVLGNGDPVESFHPVLFPEEAKQERPLARVRDVLMQKALVQGK